MTDFDFETEFLKKQEELENQYRLAFMGYPEVLTDILRDLGFNQDLDPRDIPANTLRNYAFRLLQKAGMVAVPQINVGNQAIPDDTKKEV